MGIQKFLYEHSNINPVSWHMPGHKGSDIYRRFGYTDFLERFMDYDVTEIPGADNLFQTEGILEEAQDKYSHLYNVKKSYMLINGSSAGLMAGIMASVPENGKILMARNSHKSIFNALTLAKITPIYLYPEIVDDSDIVGEISVSAVEEAIEKYDDISAVVLPSPNYYGICSNVDKIAKMVHEKNIVLIVDQAHGAHLNFFNTYKIGKDMPLAAERAGADIVINSTHKTLISMTQTAIMNINSDRVDIDVIEDKLQMIESTSPSYVFMTSLDINREILEKYGPQLISEWEDNLNFFYKEAKAISGLKVMEDIQGLDYTKINMDMSEIGVDGSKLEEILLRDNIFIELFTGNLAMCMTGIGNTRKDYERLLNSLKKISDNPSQYVVPASENKGGDSGDKLNIPKQPEFIRIPKLRNKIKLKDAVGRISASLIIPYPPGIPFLCPGERIEQDAVDYLLALRAKGEKVIGINKEKEVFVAVK